VHALRSRGAGSRPRPRAGVPRTAHGHATRQSVRSFSMGTKEKPWFCCVQMR
jgi:hypothetical protein